MALLAIYGPHAVGKTSAVHRLAVKLDETGLPVTVISADNNYERHWNGDELIEARTSGAVKWKGKQPGKRALIDNIIGDDTRIYVVESARFYSGLHLYIAERYVVYGGGVYFIHPVCSGEMFEAAMRARSERAGKRYKEEYWTPQKLVYESWKRHTNLAKRYFLPISLPYSTVRVHQCYEEWDVIDNLLWERVMLPLEGWYF